jgi:lipoate-protein ligase A
VFHEDTISFAHALADPDPRRRVDERFAATSDLVASALRRLGVEAQVGEVAGEYCPGAHSVSAGGRLKIVGIGQRLVAGGTHVGGVLVVSGADRVKRILVPVYDALGLEWRPDTTGSVADEVPGVTWQDAARALEGEYRDRHGLGAAELDEATLTLARTLAPEHLSPAD